MPFTISHVAAILPAWQWLRRRGAASAAIIGAMVPDFGFLSPWRLSRAQTHGAGALLTFCLPVGLGAWALFQWLVKPAWCAVFPGAWRRRLIAEHGQGRLGQWRSWLVAGGAGVVGALTHLIWDGFTHENGRGVRMLPLLEDSGPLVAGHLLPLYRWLQLGSSVLGLGLVLWALWRWMRAARASGAAVPAGRAMPADGLGPAECRAWIGAYLLTPLLIAALAAWRLAHLASGASLSAVATHLAFAGLGGCAASLLAISAAIRLRTAARSRLDA